MIVISECSGWRKESICQRITRVLYTKDAMVKCLFALTLGVSLTLSRLVR